MTRTTSPQEQVAARLQSFTTKAVAVVVLYWLGWIPGFSDIHFYQEAKRTELTAGRRLPLTGCLGVMPCFNVVLLAVALATATLFLISIRVKVLPVDPHPAIQWTWWQGAILQARP
jgi:hypothetical protein